MNATRRQAILALAAWAAPACANAQGEAAVSSLERVARELEREYPRLAHMRPEALAALISNRQRIHLFDVRARPEFEVSHLRGAERMAPVATASAALDQIGLRARDATIVFYCSVGRRSSRMGERTRVALQERGALSVHNLRGGIFAWRNETRPVVDAFGETSFVHPFNAAWASRLARPDLASTRARTAP